MPFDCNSLDEYITRYRVDGVLWKADQLLANVSENEVITKSERIEEIASTIALVQNAAAREDYAKRIGKKYNVSWPTFKKIIDDHLVIHRKKSDIQTAVHKNKVAKLEGDPARWPFFEEVVTINKNTTTTINSNTLLYGSRFRRLYGDGNSLNRINEFVHLTKNRIISRFNSFTNAIIVWMIDRNDIVTAV